MKKMWIIIFFLTSIHTNRCMESKLNKSPEQEQNKRISPSLKRVKKQDEIANKVPIEVFRGPTSTPIFYYANKK